MLEKSPVYCTALINNNSDVTAYMTRVCCGDVRKTHIDVVSLCGLRIMLPWYCHKNLIIFSNIYVSCYRKSWYCSQRVFLSTCTCLSVC